MAIKNIDFNDGKFATEYAAHCNESAEEGDISPGAATVVSKKPADESAATAVESGVRAAVAKADASEVIVSGIRAATQNNLADQNPLPVVEKRREPVSIPMIQGSDGELVPDYGKMDTPIFRRQQSQAADVPDYRKFDTPPFARKNEPEATTPTKVNPTKVNSGVKTQLSGALSSFIGTMKTVLNDKLGCVDFMLPDDDKVSFRRFPDSISVGDRQPDEKIILAMLELGRNDFGAIEVFGTPEFIESAVQVAIKNGIVLQNKEYIQALTPSAPKNRMRG